ncbi:MAG TPA: hypothetical protein VJM11_14200 [Nevskiaceae bacterium]|nr:hypothetical protein [Nevskiaceae bacterium]
MLFLHRAKLVILSQPKTGTSALQRALAPHASISFDNPPVYKHIRYMKFERLVRPLIKEIADLDRDEYEVVAVMREPFDWLGSWYRYRSREALSGARGEPVSERFSGNVSFEEFLNAVCLRGDARPAYARVGSPCGVSMRGKQGIGVDRLFPYEDMSGLLDLIQTKLQRKLKIERVNVSPPKELDISAETIEKVRKHFEFQFALHAALRPDGQVPAEFRAGNAPRKGKGQAKEKKRKGKGRKAA